MSIEPVDALIDAAPAADGLAEAVERHLDVHPLVVDVAEVARIAARLERRMGRTPRLTPWILGLAAAALVAATLYGLRAPPEGPGTSLQTPDIEALAQLHHDARTVHVREAPGALHFSAPGRTVTVSPESRILTSESGRTAVVLVQVGKITTEIGSVPEDHWVLLTRVEDGTARDVVFRDGEAPPRLSEDVWGSTAVMQQLEEVRWSALPDRTLETLDALLEDR